MTTNLQHEQPVRVWDLPTRFFHWGIAICFLIGWLTLDNRYLDIHVFSGYLMGGLMVFRLIWGFVGGPYASFRSFSYSLGEARDYAKSLLQPNPKRFLGHNPAGSWAIYLLLALMLSMVLTGLLTLGGEERHGPLAGWLSFAQGAFFHDIHELLAWVMLSIVAMHLVGVVVESLIHRESLAISMLTGYKKGSPKDSSSPSHWATGAGMLCFALGAGLIWFSGHLTQTPEKPYLPFVGPVLADDPLWREECGGCHLAFHPSLLPARSWKGTMATQDSHFDEDLALEQETITLIEDFLVKNAAEQFATEAAWKINARIPMNEAPLSITETAYWRDKHAELPTAIWDHPKVNGKSNCAACHLDAEAGTFEDAAMRLPSDQKSETGTK
ncbi:cytochrome b/b6 domain-containing protein [Pseudomonadota bacterium]